MLLKSEEREKLKQNKDLGDAEQISGNDPSDALQALAGGAGQPIIEKREILDLNDALFQNQAHMQMGELDEEV